MIKVGSTGTLLGNVIFIAGANCDFWRFLVSLHVCEAGLTVTLAISIVYCLEGLTLFVYLVLLQHRLLASGYKCNNLNFIIKISRNNLSLFKIALAVFVEEIS